MCACVRFWSVAALAAAALLTPTTRAVELKTYETTYYMLHTDLDADGVREATLRMELMVEAYQERTKSFKGELSKKFDFYLFTDKADYDAASGVPGSAGVYMHRGDESILMAHIGEESSEANWGTVQHEAFHQFVDRVIGGDVPLWLNEGLAEYFENMVFTGDSYVPGMVPYSRLRRIKQSIEQKDFMPLEDFFKIDSKTWLGSMNNSKKAAANYDQAWSLVHFFANGDDGAYRKPLTKFLQDIGNKGKDIEKSWRRHFGRNTEKLEACWREYWSTMPIDGHREFLTQATVRVMTNFLARSAAMGQRFTTAEEYFQAARRDAVKQPDDYWLPPALLHYHTSLATRLGRWVIRMEKSSGELTCYDPYGWIVKGSFGFRRGKVVGVKVEVTEGVGTESRRTR